MTTVEEYKRRKLLEEQAPLAPERHCCWTCHRPLKNCLCADIRPFDTRTRFLFLMHPMEARKEKMGTGRVCLATLRNSRLFVGVDFTQDAELAAEIARPGTLTALLYPGDRAWNISEAPVKGMLPSADTVLQIIVLDGTWPCAKKMMRLNRWLRELPRVSFTPGRRSIFAIKQQPDELCLSSLEAVHQVIDDLGRHGYEGAGREHDNLVDVFAKMVRFQINCANDPNIPSYRKSKGFKAPAQREPAAKWEKRNIFYRAD